MKGVEYRATMTEAQFQKQVVALADMFGWLWYHTYDSRRSPAGFPDLVMVRDGRMIFAELKKEGKWPTAAQEEWINALSGYYPVFVWHPSDLPEIERILR